MKYKTIILLFILSACSPQLITLNKKEPYAANGFAYIYNEFDFNEKVIKSKMNNDNLQISHQNLKTGTLIKISNPNNKKSLVLKNIKRIRYPEFYKVLITEAVAEKLELDKNFPLLEILEVKKNKSFVAKEAKTFNEEKKISSKAPVENIQISNISKEKSLKDYKTSEQIYILLGSFYSVDTANFLKQRITKDVPEFNINKLRIKKSNNKENLVISGPYSSINSVKNDYILLKTFGFEELDIFFNE
jgi:rare lipoprotein A (peptidoglycan hydrolase)|tara:strand:+ start:5088 stop:5825 length:738 start_codon:yes stop_codon:yes gene_type:complete